MAVLEGSLQKLSSGLHCGARARGWVITMAMLVLAWPALTRAETGCAGVDDDGLLTANVASVIVTASFLLNGSPFPVSAANAARIYLVKDGLIQAHLGDTDQVPQPVHVLAGTYDLMYQHKNGVLVPQNGEALFVRNLPVTSSGTLVVNVLSVVQAGNFILDGSPFPAVDYEDALIYAARTGSDDEVLLGNTHDGSYSLSLLPGNYDIVYRRESGGATVPSNSRAKVDTRAITANNLSAHVQVTSALQSGNFLFNGAPAPASIYENGKISLRTAGGDLIDLGETMAQSYSKRLIPGAYNIHYEVLVSNGVAPRNPDFRLQQGVNLVGGSYDINVPSKTVIGDFTLNGSPTPASIYENAEIALVDRQIQAKTVLGETKDQAYARRLIPGSYDVSYRKLVSSAQQVPLNDNVLFDRISVPSGGLIQVELDIDIPSTELTVGSTLDGQPWPASGPAAGELSLLNPDGTPSLVLGSTQGLPVTVPVVSGFYRLAYSHLGGKAVPANEQARWPALSQVTGASAMLNYPFRSLLLKPDLLLNGSAWPSNPAQSGRLFLTIDEDFLELSPTSAPAQTRALQGAYALKYAHDQGNSVPLNFLQRLTCFYAELCFFCDGFE